MLVTDRVLRNLSISRSSASALAISTMESMATELASFLLSMVHQETLHQEKLNRQKTLERQKLINDDDDSESYDSAGSLGQAIEVVNVLCRCLSNA